MAETWSQVRLAEVAQHRTESIQIDDSKSYARCRVQLHARGIVLRDRVPGADIKTKTQWVAHSEDFLVAEIDAKLGGYGIVPTSLSGAVVSSHYFLFELDKEKILPRWLGLFCQTEAFHSQVVAKGSTNYSAVRPKGVLEYKIPLPPIETQRKLVSKLDSTLNKLDAARIVAQEVSSDFERLLIAMAHRNDLTEEQKLNAGWRRVKLGEAVEYQKREVVVNDFDSYLRISVRLWGRGIDVRDRPKGLDIKTKKQFVVRKDDFIVAEMDAKFGAFGILPQQFDGAIVSSHYFAFAIDRAVAMPEWLHAYCKGQSFQEQVVARGSTNYSAVRPKQILEYQIWLPPLKEQDRIAEVFRAKQQYEALNTFEKDAEALRRSILAKAFRGELV